MKLVMVVNNELPLGLIANTTAVLGITVGDMFEEVLGPDISDGDGNLHLGITARVIPILGGSRDMIKTIRDKAMEVSEGEIRIIDFSEVAQSCKDYKDYSSKLKNMNYEDIYYLGICLYGPRKKINKLTGNLALLR